MANSVFDQPCFCDEQAAFDRPETINRPRGLVCPHCGVVGKAGALNGVKDKKGRERIGLKKCYACGAQFSEARARVLESAPKEGVLAEIGVWKGEFSRQLLDVVRPSELYLIDPWKFVPGFPARWYGGAIAKNQGDMDAIMRSVAEAFAAYPEVVLRREPSVSAAASFPNRYFDWIYIDGDHSHDAVLADLRAWQPKMKPGGLICLDDYDWRDEKGQLSVREAIHEFLAESRVEAATPLAGQFFLRLPV